MNNTVTYKTTFECGYIQGLQFNAHRYQLEVCVENLEQTDNRIIIRFEDLKHYVDEVLEVFNNALLYGTDTPAALVKHIRALGMEGLKCTRFDKDLYVENFCEYIALTLNHKLLDVHRAVTVKYVKLNESPQFSATWGI